MAQNQNLNALAQQAGLNQQQKDQIDGLSKLLNSHQSLMSMPSDVAAQEFAKKTPDQQKAHTSFFGDNNPLGDALQDRKSVV